MSALQLWDIEPGTIPAPEAGSGFLFFNAAGVLCRKDSAGAVVPVGGGGGGVEGPAGPAGPVGPVGPAGAAGAQGAPGVNGLDGAQGPQGVQGLQGQTGAQGVQGVPGAGVSRLLAVPYPYLGAFTTSPAIVLSFDPAVTGDNYAVSFLVIGSNNHMTTAANMVIQLRIGGAVVLTQTFALGTTARTNRAWRVAGQVVFVSGFHTFSMGGAVDLVTVQAPVGNGVLRDNALGTYIEVSVALSAAVAGASASVLGGYAVREH